MNSHIYIKGEVSLRGYNQDGELVLSVDKKNLVVTTGKQRMAALLATGNIDYIIDGIIFGTSAAAPTLSDTHSGVTDPFQKAVGSISYPTANSVKWEWTLEFSESNGITIREIGLVSGVGAGDEALFSRIVTDAIAKTSGLRLEGSWKITF
jgi:hypothetical protein